MQDKITESKLDSMSITINKITACYLLLAVFLLVFDRIAKSYVYLNQVIEYKIFGDYFKISFALNPYIAFSLPLSGFLLVLIIIIILIIILIATIKFYILKNYHLAGLSFLIFIGASSNLFDRFKYGAVIDYFNLKYFTVFNLADSMIVICAVFIFFIFSNKKPSIFFL
jgi:signal peptidase II